MSASYPYYTPYQFAGNNPIKFIDLDGLEPIPPPTEEEQKIQIATGQGVVDAVRSYTFNSLVNHRTAIKGGLQILGGTGMFQAGAALSTTGYGAIIGVPMMILASGTTGLGASNIMYDLVSGGGGGKEGPLTGYTNSGQLFGSYVGPKTSRGLELFYHLAAIPSSGYQLFKAGGHWDSERYFRGSLSIMSMLHNSVQFYGGTIGQYYDDLGQANRDKAAEQFANLKNTVLGIDFSEERNAFRESTVTTLNAGQKLVQDIKGAANLSQNTAEQFQEGVSNKSKEAIDGLQGKKPNLRGVKIEGLKVDVIKN